MSKLYEPAFAEPKGALIRPYPTTGILMAQGAGAPTASAAGYSKGCIYLDTTNGQLYINQGTVTSATWAAEGALPAAKFTSFATAQGGTFADSSLSGANFVCYTHITTASPGTITTPTATAILAAMPGVYVNQTYLLRIINGQGTGTLTVGAGASVTLTGTMTIALNTWRDFVVTVTAVTTPAVTLQNAGTGTFS